MIPPLVNFDLAKKHLRLLANDLDTEVDLKLRLASSIVAAHCKLTDVPDEWISETEPVTEDESIELILLRNASSSPPDTYYIRVPGDIQAAVLLILSDLFYNGDASTSELLSETVINLLTPHRDPTIA